MRSSDPAEFAGIVRTLDADRAVYSFAIRGEHIELLGVVSLIARLSGKLTEARPLADGASTGAARPGVLAARTCRCAPNSAPANAISTCASAIWI